MNKPTWIFLLILGVLTANLLVAAPGKIKAGDTIKVWVKGEPDLTVERTVGNDGSVSFPLLGRVGVAGLKSHHAAKVIEGMLEDGYLRDPLVQITLKSPKKSQRTTRPRSKFNPYAQTEPLPRAAAPRTASRQPIRGQPATANEEPVLIEVVDGRTGANVGGAAMLLNNKIYQSNKLGQMIIDSTQGKVVLIADGYKIISAELSEVLKPGNPAQILVDRVKLASSVTFQVLDAFTRKPLRRVQVNLDKMRIKTNSQGVFKINQIKTEFGRVTLKKRGYKTVSKIVDFKGSEKQILLMVKK